MTGSHTGACFCGAVEISATGEPVEMGFCHCASCRSYSGAPVTAFTLWKDEQVKVTRGADLIAGSTSPASATAVFARAAAATCWCSIRAWA